MAGGIPIGWIGRGSVLLIAGIVYVRVCRLLRLKNGLNVLSVGVA